MRGDGNACNAIAYLVRRIEKVETAIAPRLQAFFVEAIVIPHLTATYPRRREVMALSEQPLAAASEAARTRQRADRRAG